MKKIKKREPLGGSLFSRENNYSVIRLSRNKVQ